MDYLFKINLIKLMKFIPLYAHISGTKESFVIPEEYLILKGKIYLYNI